MSESAVESLLLHFPGPIYLKRGPKDELPSGLLIIPPVLTAIFFIMNVVQGYSIQGWIVVALFALLTVVTGIWFRGPPPEAPHLTLNREGFQLCSGRFTTQSLWADCSDFIVSPLVSPYGAKYPAIRFHNQNGERIWLTRLIMRVWPYNGLLGPVDGLSIEQLAELMTRWRDMALAQNQRGEIERCNT